MITTITLCTTCRHHINAHDGRPDGPPPSMWYYQFCGHPDVKRPTAVDPVSGEVRYRIANGPGTTGLTDEPHPYCRDINDGDCVLWKPLAMTEPTDRPFSPRPRD